MDASQFNKEYFSEILEQNKEEIRSQVSKNMIEVVSSSFSHELPLILSKELEMFSEEHILPEIRKLLHENKDALICAVTEMISEVPAEIAKALQSHCAEKLSNSWNVRKILEAIT